MKLDNIRSGVGALWDTMTEGWDRLRQTTAGALTRYKPADDQGGMPEPHEVLTDPLLSKRLMQGPELSRAFMLRYDLYRHYFPMMALARAGRLSR